MEATAAAPRGSPLPMPSSQSNRKEWRAVSESSVCSAANEDLGHGNLEQLGERTIYEVQQGTEALDVDFSSITIDGGLEEENDLLRQQLRSISRQREEIQQIEVELRAQAIVRSETIEMQKRLNMQLEEHVNTAVKLQEQLQTREQYMHELERRMEEKDRELHAIKIDNEAAWTKEDLHREQNIELANFRRERDSFEAERVQHLKQMHDLKEHIREKDNQLLALQEQHRVMQEAVLYKEEQLREEKAWLASIQEIDALQSSTNHSLQAELHERTEQFNQFWFGCQGQFQEVERHYLQVIEQLQLELSEAREQTQIQTENSQIIHTTSKDESTYVQKKGNKFNANEGGMLCTNSGTFPNGNNDNAPPFTSADIASTKTNHVSGVQIVPSSIHAMGVFLPPPQMATLHPLVMHQQGAPHSLSPANILQSHISHFQSSHVISSHQHWQNQQAVSENSQMQKQMQCQPSQNKECLLSSDAHYVYELSAGGRHSDYLNAHISPRHRSGSVVPTSSEDPQILESNEKVFSVSDEPKENVQEGPPMFHDILRFEPPDQKIELKQGDDGNMLGVTNQLQDEQTLTTEKPIADADPSLSTPNRQGGSDGTTESNLSAVNLPDRSNLTGRTSSLMASTESAGPILLDERSLLACIVRTIPTGSSGGIKISTTLPNRLGKMLAPLHWHDYKKQFGKLDVFVAGHPELFVIEGDCIRLREGAQEIISATTAIAKVAAAVAAVSSSHSLLLPSVALTPVAQAHRAKKVPIIDPMHACNKSSQLLVKCDQHSNGTSSNIVQGFSNVNFLKKPNAVHETNGFSSDVRSLHSSSHLSIGNGSTLERTGPTTFQNK